MRSVIAALLVVPVSLAAQSTRLTVSSTRPEPGSLVRLTLRDSTPADSVTRIQGVMAGEPLHFARVDGAWRALGPVPADASGRVVARVRIERRSGKADSARVAVTVPVVKVATSRLSVDSTFSRPMDSATAARVANENARAREVGRRAHDTPQLWTSTFLRPRNSEITSSFGTGRLFNGRLTSRHLGVDFRGAVGTPVLAANRGVVALVDTFFLAGRVVYIDHGAGIVTSYFHLSEALVAAGDTVSRGQRIGLVGQSGRVTGPHLHWSARYGTLAVNPLHLVTLAR